MEITKVDARRKLLQGRIGGNTFNLDPVRFFQFVPWIGNSRLKSAIIGQHNQAFGIGIKATGRIDVWYRNVIGQRGPTGVIGKLGQYPKGLVEKNEATQAGQPPPKTLQKRCSSG